MATKKQSTGSASSSNGTKKTRRTRKSSMVTKTGLLRGASYFALTIAAFMFLFGGIFSGQIAGILNLVGKLLLLVGIGIPAYDYTRGKKKAWRIVFWVALIVYICGCVFGIIGGLV